jgi:hypothetical protein
MSCDIAGTSYNIDGSILTVPATPSDDNKDVCRATKILDRLHKDFTEKYYTTAGMTNAGTADSAKTAVDSALAKPSYYLRNQPKSNTDTTNVDINRFYENVTNSSTDNGDYKGSAYYRKMISVIMKGDNVNNIAELDYDKVPDTIIGLTDFSDGTSANFKGIYGTNRVIEILEKKINTILSGLSPSNPSAVSSGEAITRFGQRKEIKNTLEEVAYRENQIYREKFLNLILIMVGIFVVGSQLVQKYFSEGGSSGGGGGGLGGLFGFGVGGGGGLFSRFGGLGLGSSGRSRIGNLFTNSSYALKQR